jgi:hypothetical protein
MILSVRIGLFRSLANLKFALLVRGDTGPFFFCECSSGSQINMTIQELIQANHSCGNYRVAPYAPVVQLWVARFSIF